MTAGILGGLFGIGGGAIMVPVMVLLLGFEQRIAEGTSLAARLLPVGVGIRYMFGGGHPGT